MATDFVAGRTNQELRAASTASGGTALTTTAGYIQLPLGSKYLYITPRNFATAVVAKVALNPWLVVLKTTDILATAPTDYSSAAQDADASTNVTLDALGTLANGDWLLVGSHLPFRGVYCDVDGANAVNATLTVTAWNGSAWADTSATDGTNSSGTFAVDGLIYWTVPTTWPATKLSDIYPGLAFYAYYTGVPLYWTRWVVSAALTNPTTLNSMVAANRSTAYMELVPGQTYSEKINHAVIGGIGCVEALTDAGTANLIVNVGAGPGGRFS